MGRAFNLMLRGEDHTEPLTESESDEAYEDAGTAASTLAAHAAAGDPHPQYLTAAEGGAAYAPLAHAAHATDAQLRARTSHTGSQSKATISDLETLAAGTYTPTFTGVTNVAAIGAAVAAQYQRVGNVITVSGRVTVTPTAASAATEVGISLPIASALASGLSNTCNGVAASENASDQGCAQILPDDTNDRARMLFYSKSTTGRFWSFHFSYLVV